MKKIVFIFCLFVFTQTIFAFDFGGSTQDLFTLDIKNDGTHDLCNNLESTLWLKTPLDFYGHTNFIVDISFILDSKHGYKPNIFFDINKFLLKMKIPLSNSYSCYYSMGRDSFSDITSYIYNGKIDALSFSFDLFLFDFSFLGGYTGLINSRNPEKLYSLKPGMFIGEIKFNFVENSFLKNLLIEGLYIFNNAKPKTYINIFFNKSLTDKIDLELVSSFQFFTDSNSGIANLSEAKLIYNLLNSSINAKLFYTTIKNTYFDTFSLPEGTISSIDYFDVYPATETISAGLNYTYILKNKNKFLFDIDLFYNLKDGEIKYNGLEYSLDFYIQVTSDINLTFSFGQLFNSTAQNRFMFDSGLKISY